ncbi:MAG: hypothetical protein DDT27_01662 [Dehalococcoidia bacterium]|nr:hypothetical protein [Chloroflexota bacterium]MBT9163093.1 hypothetical protein [Chloroflexota bacterium]
MLIFDHCLMAIIPFFRSYDIAVPFLHFLGKLEGKPQTNGNIISDLIAGYGQNSGMANAAFLENCDIGGSTADISQHDTILFLLFAQDSFGAG